MFVRVFAVEKRGDVRPSLQSGERQHGRGIPDAGQILIRHRRGDERVLPRAVARGPVAHDRGKLADLHIEAPVFPRRQAQRVFIEPEPRAAVARIEAAVHARLREKVNVRAELAVEKEREARIEKPVAAREKQSRRRLLEKVSLEIHRAAQAQPDVFVENRNRQRLVEPVQPLVHAVRGGDADQEAGAKCGRQFHAGAWAAIGAGVAS